ncbi:hypothetical protein GCM10007036_14160 [Alsobacter metallidurans]|uniref:ParB-like N-terminal domain-containing protein n=1 Tax=Alsobacter metallidurans TaxID=340221 RepID=A0A917MH56_9HYPH|nr:ParB/RepB/Spo0J family partition protein [Alsobacter metallidurans]GGH14666.1 hypothetical protein GCM10007036_14160 [Alsobacter metallidurans]
MSQKVREIRLDQIEANPNQPRKLFDETKIADLAASIKANGLMQPITVRPLPRKVGEQGRYMIVAGERRFRAHKHMGAETIRCLAVEMTEDEMAVKAIIENLQRADVTAMEEARAFQSMLDRGYTVAALMKELGLKSRNRVLDRVNLLRLNPEFQTLVEGGNLPPAYACEIATLPAALQVKVIRQVSTGQLKTAEQVRHAVIALREALAQDDIFAAMPAATEKEVAVVNRMEAKVEQIAALAALGFKDNECTIAKKVDPNKVKGMADKLALIRNHLLQMEHALRAAAAQGEILAA